jgi:hypothetical protein
VLFSHGSQFGMRGGRLMIVGRMCQTPFIIFSNSAAVSMSILPTRTGAPFGPSPKIETHRFAGNRLSNRMNTHEGRCAFRNSGAAGVSSASAFAVQCWMSSVGCFPPMRLEHRTSNAQHRTSKAEKKKAGEGNRTLVCSLGSYRSTIELHPRDSFDFEADNNRLPERVQI